MSDPYMTSFSSDFTTLNLGLHYFGDALIKTVSMQNSLEISFNAVPLYILLPFEVISILEVINHKYH